MLASRTVRQRLSYALALMSEPPEGGGVAEDEAGGGLAEEVEEGITEDEEGGVTPPERV